MDLTIKQVPLDTLNALRAQARENGETLEEYARSVLNREAENSSSRGGRKNAEKIEAFNEWMNGLPSGRPVLSDEDISRESIYEEQIQRQI